MDSNRSLQDREIALTRLRARIEELKRRERRLSSEIEEMKFQPGLAALCLSFGWRRISSASVRYRILTYIHKYDLGIESKHLHSEMELHGIKLNYNTLRVNLLRMSEEGIVQKPSRGKKWRLTDSGTNALNGLFRP